MIQEAVPLLLHLNLRLISVQKRPLTSKFSRRLKAHLQLLLGGRGGGDEEEKNVAIY